MAGASQHEKALKAFADGSVAALVATDVAARGVHVDAVAGVVHFDVPADSATYVHRSGEPLAPVPPAWSSPWWSPSTGATSLRSSGRSG
ncbi:MAG: helicase-related protein [Ilumatobacteraceae bacterium]